MPLSNFQAQLLRLLAANRDPESYVAGSTPLIRNAQRYSSDIDIFHDQENRVAESAVADGAFLEERGYVLQWIRRGPSVYTAVVQRSGGDRLWTS